MRRRERAVHAGFNTGRPSRTPRDAAEAAPVHEAGAADTDADADVGASVHRYRPRADWATALGRTPVHPPAPPGGASSSGERGQCAGGARASPPSYRPGDAHRARVCSTPLLDSHPQHARKHLNRANRTTGRAGGRTHEHSRAPKRAAHTRGTPRSVVGPFGRF